MVYLTMSVFCLFGAMCFVYAGQSRTIGEFRIWATLMLASVLIELFVGVLGTLVETREAERSRKPTGA
jgi:hypothetical protein